MQTHDLTLVIVVSVFWIFAIARAQQRHYRWFPNFVLLPLVFIPIGLWVNRVQPALGTYIIFAMHALLLLAVTAMNRRKKRA